ncbi:sigma-54 dependent transcriptional regulator [Desulfovibrio sp. OttesenSCG-928-G15]|nr:sigma-54 dependent transcriptional regulator [Desulfovibrio sp. OttesenSCG-928-G15]
MDAPAYEALLTQALAVSARPVKGTALASLAGVTKTAAESTLRGLCAKGLAVRLPGGSWQTKIRLEQAESARNLLREEAPEDSLPLHLSFLADRIWVEHIDHMLAFLDEQLRVGSPAAQVCLKLVAEFFLQLGTRLVQQPDPVQNRKFLETVILLQVLCFSNRLCTDEATRLSYLYYEINLPFRSEGFPLYLELVKKFTDFSLSKGSIAKGLAQSLVQLPDPSGNTNPLSLQANPFVSVFKELFSTVEHKSGQAETQILNVIATGLSHIAMHMRNFSISEQIATALLNIDQDSRQANDAISMIWLSHYCFVLLRQGKLDEAVEHITLLFNCIDTKSDPLSFASAARGLALYHFFLGREKHAHTVLSKETRFAIDHNIAHAHFLDPMNFDMLFVFEQKGYPPVPRYELTPTIEGVLAQGSQLMQGTALRIKALRLRAEGGHPAEVIRLLQASREKLHPERDVRELVLTLHELANTLTIAGAYEDARHYRQIIAAHAGRPIDPDISYQRLAFIATCIPVQPASGGAEDGAQSETSGSAAQARDITLVSPPDLDDDVIIGDGMRAVLQIAGQAATSGAQILLQGETGVGKELVARHIHAQSGRNGAFVAIHPASTSETLFESEFFGHERGAFTGATATRKGFFEEADQGTLFIDEVGDIPPLLQTKLLRVLQEKRFMRVGSNKLIDSNFRLITATHKDLRHEVERGLFRRDLLFRIAVIPIFIPPLRERSGDILPLALAYLAKFSRMYAKTTPKLDAQAKAALTSYPWPGNVRELRNAMERIVVQGVFNRDFLRYAPLPGEKPETLPAVGGVPPFVAGNMLTGECDKAHSVPGLSGCAGPPGLPSLEEVEKSYLAHVLHITGGKVRGENGAAALLGVKSSTLYAMLKRHGLGKR